MEKNWGKKNVPHWATSEWNSRVTERNLMEKVIFCLNLQTSYLFETSHLYDCYFILFS